MSLIAGKRLRSDESPSAAIQLKMYINQRIIDQNDHNKMQEIHAKTVRQLFVAARQNKDTAKLPSSELWQRIVLTGDGNIKFHNVANNFTVERKQSKCCGRESFVLENCKNCTLNLCETCGFSCLECGRFLCRACVTLFGCGTVEQPICERCAMFN